MLNDQPPPHSGDIQTMYFCSPVRNFEVEDKGRIYEGDGGALVLAVQNQLEREDIFHKSIIHIS